MNAQLDWTRSVCQSVGSECLSDLGRCVVPITEVLSPIDGFYAQCTSQFRVAVPSFFEAYPEVSGLLVVGIVSAVEGYFRELVSKLLNLCPISREKAADKVMKISSVLWYRSDHVLSGVLEHVSLADSESVKKVLRDFLGFEYKATSPLVPVLKEFDKVCELRHSIVHSKAVLAAKNALKLNICTQDCVVSLRYDYSLFQECCAVCSALVATINAELFREFAKRWAVDWPRVFNQPVETLDDNFQTLWDIFFSRTDFDRGLIDISCNVSECKSLIKQQFGR